MVYFINKITNTNILNVTLIIFYLYIKKIFVHYLCKNLYTLAYKSAKKRHKALTGTAD